MTLGLIWLLACNDKEPVTASGNDTAIESEDTSTNPQDSATRNGTGYGV